LSLVLLATVGCSDAPAPEPLCDPSDTAATRIALEQRTPRAEPGEALLYDNGATYVFVDRQCNYWASNPSRVWEETHAGVLDSETAARLGAQLHVNAWDELGGTWNDPAGGWADAPTLIFDNAATAVVCADFCDASSVPDEVKAMRDALSDVAQELWDRGTAAPSRLRVVALPMDASVGGPFVDWPLARPISDFVRTSGGFGQGVLEDDGASVQALKALRRSFLDGEHGAFVWGMLPVKSGGAYYGLYVRDALPFEDARGLVPLSLR
jgi:hypothetical protein